MTPKMVYNFDSIANKEGAIGIPRKACGYARTDDAHQLLFVNNNVNNNSIQKKQTAEPLPGVCTSLQLLDHGIDDTKEGKFLDSTP